MNKVRLLLPIYILIGLAACTSNDNAEQTKFFNGTNNTGIEKQIDEQPAKTIIDFLKWYRDHQTIQGGLVNNASNDKYDSTKYYSVNYEATEKYLTDLKTTGFISPKYIDKWREYFKKCEKNFEANPSNDGPPEGFEYDFVMLSQETEDNLKDLEKTQITDSKISENTSVVNLHFINGDNLQYRLTKTNDKWLIDDIERK
ncbi:MAG TPA: hypothetical protein VF868_00090 [Bacteroidia bacterium]|jgi:hypothetical protein